MSKSNHSTEALLSSYFERELSLQKKRIKQAKKSNKLAKKQYQQSLLAYEQTERQYLLEKSRLQPSFRLSVTEFLLCEPDFVNDPEQAGEAQFLSKLGVDVDERVLRFRLHVKGAAEYLRPSLVLALVGQDELDEQAYSMTELLYFMSANRMITRNKSSSFEFYFVYRDKTTLPVVLRYRASKRRDSALLRWEVEHVDTVYAMSQQGLSELKSSKGCRALFADRGE